MSLNKLSPLSHSNSAAHSSQTEKDTSIFSVEANESNDVHDQDVSRISLSHDHSEPDSFTISVSTSGKSDERAGKKSISEHYLISNEPNSLSFERSNQHSRNNNNNNNNNNNINNDNDTDDVHKPSEEPASVEAFPEEQLGAASTTTDKKRGFFGELWHYMRLVVGFIVPYGGLLSCSFNMASATLGAGIVSIPSGFNLSGIAMSTIYLVLVCLGTIYSMNLLAKVMIKTNLRTYSMAARHLLGPGIDYCLAILIMILCFGGSVAYIIATSTLLSPVLQTPNSPAYLKTRSGNRLMTSLVWLVLMLPLVIPKRINSLRYFSSIGVLFIVYFVVCIVIHSVTHGYNDPAKRKEMVTMRTGNDALEGLGVFMFAYMCQLNAFEIFHEMRHKTVFHFTFYATLSMGTCALLYFLAGYFGYADFGEKVKDSVLTLYDPVSEPYIAVGYVGIVFKICVAFTMHMIPFRDAMYHFFHWNAATLPYWKHALVMAVPTTAALLCGLFIPTLNTVLGLLGSFCGGIIGLIMPALFFMYSGNFTLRQVGVITYTCTYLLLIGGVLAAIFGTVTTIYSTAMNSFK